MSANLNARDFTQPGTFGKNAQTIIPVSPQPGIAYRDPNVATNVYEQGQPFDTIVDSRIWNQMFYLFSSFSGEGERFGFFRWSPLSNYVVGSNVTGTDGNLYKAMKNSGASTSDGPKNPMDNPDYWWTLKDYLAQGGLTGGTIQVGWMQLLPFRYNALPPFWYFCNGERFPDTSAIAQALQDLPANLRLDFNITTTGNGTNVPNWFYNGKGVFPRAVDNTSRLPGSIEDHAIPRIQGSVTGNDGNEPLFLGDSAVSSGALRVSGSTFGGYGSDTGAGLNVLTFDSQTSLPSNTADETRPLNIGMTPAIYLGV